MALPILAPLAKAAVGFLTNLAIATFSEPMIEWFFFYVAERITQSTKTKHDDVFLANAKAAYEKGKE